MRVWYERYRFSCDESSCLMQSCLFCECNIFVRFFDGVDADAVGLFHFMFHKMKDVATACYMYNIKFSLLLNDKLYMQAVCKRLHCKCCKALF